MREARPTVSAARRNGRVPILRVVEFLRRNSVTGRLGVAVSGGSDSVALFHLLVSLAGEHRLELSVLHFNHGLRGAESDGDEAFVREQAHNLGVSFVSERAGEAPKSNLEAWARDQRLAFFQRERARLRLDWIATGHTRDDQAETVLMRVLRGSGSAGLAGILPVTREGLVRPLLGCTREELRDWLKVRGVSWREDRTNADAGLADRNRVRLELLPQLRAQWNPQLDQALARLAEVAQAEETYWAAEVERLSPEALVFEVARVKQLPLALQRRLMRRALSRAKGNLRQIEFQHIEQVLALFDRKTGNGRVKLPGGVMAERSFGQVRVVQAVQAEGLRNPTGVVWSVVDRNANEIGVYNRGGYYLDARKVTLPLIPRSWQSGDVFCPAGSDEPKKMKDLFQAARVPCWERHDWPMLVSSGSVVWTRGFGVAAGLEAGPGVPVVIEIEDFGETTRKLESNHGLPASIV